MRLILTLLIGVCLVQLFPSNSLGSGDGLLTGVKLEDLTPKDSPLQFQFQKIKWQNDWTLFWGVVTNSGNKDFEFVSVAFTALDSDGQFLGREKIFTDPHALNGGDRCDINSYPLDTEGRIPAIIQFKVSGSPK